MFNAKPKVQALPLYDGHECLIVDDALQDPQGWVAWASTQRERFAPSRHAYPGVELWLAEEAMARFGEFFAEHIRGRLGARRTINIANRLSLVTQPPQQLAARQWFCHRDNKGIPAGECMAASVIFLFEDPSLGGTSFYRPRRPPAETEQLVQECTTLADDEFARRHPEIPRGYMLEGNDWFERVASVPARWNRALFYDGSVFHSGDIRHPERMCADPELGRLTMNGFMRCRLKAA